MLAGETSLFGTAATDCRIAGKGEVKRLNPPYIDRHQEQTRRRAGAALACDATASFEKLPVNHTDGSRRNIVRTKNNGTFFDE